MLSFLFWNLKGNDRKTWVRRSKNLRLHLRRLVHGLEVDILLLAECGFAPREVLDLLNADAPAYCFPTSDSSRIQLFTRLIESSVVDQFNNQFDRRLTIRRIALPKEPILLATVHFPSQMASSDGNQASMAPVIFADIPLTEDTVGHQRTVLVGDLNMNPFHPGVIDGNSLNAVMTRDLARRRERTIYGRARRFFYNPMWGLFGDRTPGPAGTYFYQDSDPLATFWHLYDQVLLRPALMDSLTELRIIDHDGEESLVDSLNQRPRKSTASDHLPLLFRLDL